MANAYEQTLPVATPGQDREYPTVTDLSTYQYCSVMLDADNLLVPTTTGAVGVGILQDAPVGSATALRYGMVRLFGQSRVKLSGAVVNTIPYLKVDSSGGTLIACASNLDQYVAVAKSGGAANDLVVALVQNGRYAA